MGGVGPSHAELVIVNPLLKVMLLSGFRSPKMERHACCRPKYEAMMILNLSSTYHLWLMGRICDCRQACNTKTPDGPIAMTHGARASTPALRPNNKNLVELDLHARVCAFSDVLGCALILCRSCSLFNELSSISKSQSQFCDGLPTWWNLQRRDAQSLRGRMVLSGFLSHARVALVNERFRDPVSRQKITSSPVTSQESLPPFPLFEYWYWRCSNSTL